MKFKIPDLTGIANHSLKRHHNVISKIEADL
jgi:hypothetical protein